MKDDEPANTERIAIRTESKRQQTIAAIADVTGVDVNVPLAIALSSYPSATTDLEVAYDDMQEEKLLSVTTARAEITRKQYRTQKREFMEERGIVPRQTSRLAPSRTTAGRRKAHIAKKAARLGITFAEAEAMTPKRHNATRGHRA